MSMRSEIQPPGGPKRKARNVVLVGASAALVAVMLGLTYASVPLYRLFCQVTGFSGTTQIATKAPGAVAAAPIQVRFDANVAVNMPWRFTPPDPVEVRLGEQRQVAFTAVSASAMNGAEIAGARPAAPAVAPARFRKPRRVMVELNLFPPDGIGRLLRRELKIRHRAELIADGDSPAEIMA